MPPKRKSGEAIAVEEEQSNWNNLTIADLKIELARRSLPVSGTKVILVNRLYNAEQTTQANSQIDPSWKTMKVAQLKDELAKRGLPRSGTKAELIQCLEKNAASPAAEISIASRPKRARRVEYAEPQGEVNELSSEPEEAESEPVDETGERRPKPYVPGPTPEYNKKLKKAQTERLFMLDRNKGYDKEGYPQERFDIAGSTGSVYDVTIARSPRCTCMDARARGQKCKHIKYALIIILKAPSHLCWQDAFLSSELRTIFDNAPVTRAPAIAHGHAHEHEEDESMYNGKRKPVEGECPICVCDMEPGEELVWCKAACGQNFHKECFDQWKSSKHGGQITCVYCRQPWQEDALRMPDPGSLAGLKSVAPKVGHYKNVAHLMPQYQDPNYTSQEQY